jgi:hypothetical protein
MYFRKKTSGGRAYLQIVESRRDGAQVRQQVIATLGRIEDLRDSGQLELQRDNQDDGPATIRMTQRRRRGDEGRA